MGLCENFLGFNASCRIAMSKDMYILNLTKL